jgi:hypothetical protein
MFVDAELPENYNGIRFSSIGTKLMNYKDFYLCVPNKKLVFGLEILEELISSGQCPMNFGQIKYYLITARCKMIFKIH